MYACLNSVDYWPAKVLRCVEKELEVVFFGGIFSSKPKKVPISRCFWLSEEFPTEVMKFKCQKYKNINADMNKMRDELKLHIEELEKKFGEFQYAGLNSSINITIPHVYLPKQARINIQ